MSPLHHSVPTNGAAIWIFSKHAEDKEFGENIHDDSYRRHLKLSLKHWRKRDHSKEERRGSQSDETDTKRNKCWDKFNYLTVTCYFAGISSYTLKFGRIRIERRESLLANTFYFFSFQPFESILKYRISDYATNAHAP